MAYYFMGGEDLDFSPIGGPTITTNASLFRTGFARCGLATGAGQRWRVPASYGYSVTGNWWWTARLIQEMFSGNLLIFNGPGDVAALAIDYNGNVFTITGGVPTLVSPSTGPVPFNVLTKADINVNFGSSGSITVYFDGDIINEFTGNVTGGQSSLAGFDMGSGGTSIWSEVMWADHDTRALGLVTLPAVANGNANTWDVHAVGNIDGIQFNDAQTDQSGTALQIDQYTVGALPSGNFGIDAVEVVARAVTTSGAPQNLQLMVRAGGTNYNSSSILQGVAFQRNANIWLTNPNTSTYWQQGDLGSGFNIGVESET
jgi:hypothetical protein